MKDGEDANVGEAIITVVISIALSGTFTLLLYVFGIPSNDLMLSICILFILFTLILDDWTTSAKIEEADRLIEQYTEYTNIIGNVTLLLAQKIKLLENNEDKI